MEMHQYWQASDDDPWGYIRINPLGAKRFVEAYKRTVESVGEGEYVPSCFIHESQAYRLTPNSNTPVPDRVITPIGIVFLQGKVGRVKDFLETRLPEYHLVNDKATNSAAQIPARQMRMFMTVAEARPDAIKYLDNPITSFQSYAKIRILTGVLKGQTGYYVRLKRDRKLVVGMGGITIAYGGIFKEKFEFIE